MSRHPSLALAALLSLSPLACTPSATGSSSDAGTVERDGGRDDGDGGSDGGGPALDGGDDAGTPSDDAGLELDELSFGEPASGAITESGQQDAYRVDTTGARFYRVSLTLPAGSALAPHLTVIDDGRDDDPPGADFVQISRVGGADDGNLEFVSAGDGHFVVVRDARNVGGAGGEGSPAHTYTVSIEELALDDVSAGELTFPSTISGALAHAGAVNAYRFEATAFTNALFELNADGDMDGRLFVIAESTGDWIARNDDQASSVDPLIDAPLTEGGVLWLVVDNVNESATDLGYTLTVDVQ